MFEISAPAKPVDALVVVAHDAEVLVLRRQQPDKPVLGMVRVLVLVDQDMRETGPDNMPSTSWCRSKSLTVSMSRSSKSSPPDSLSFSLVERVDPRDRLVETEMRARFRELLSVGQVVLERADPRADRPRLVLLGVDPQVRHAGLDERGPVRLVVDHERASCTPAR